jgi:hypothetical protein
LTSLYLARLHFELLHLKLTETDATENLTVANNRIRTLETRLLRSDERFDAKERALQHSRTEFSYQVSRMRTTITVSHQTNNLFLTHSFFFSRSALDSVGRFRCKKWRNITRKWSNLIEIACRFVSSLFKYGSTGNCDAKQ